MKIMWACGMDSSGSG